MGYDTINLIVERYEDIAEKIIIRPTIKKIIKQNIGEMIKGGGTVEFLSSKKNIWGYIFNVSIIRICTIGKVEPGTKCK